MGPITKMSPTPIFEGRHLEADLAIAVHDAVPDEAAGRLLLVRRVLIAHARRVDRVAGTFFTKAVVVPSALLVQDVRARRNPKQLKPFSS